MSYSVFFDGKSGIVNVCISEAPTKEDHYAAHQEAMHLCRENNVSNILVDLSDLNADSYSIAGCHEFGISIAQASLDMKIAHVLPADPKSSELVSFTSVVEFNRGVMAGEFKAIEEARRWLLE